MNNSGLKLIQDKSSKESKFYREMKQALPEVELYDNTNDRLNPLEKSYKDLTMEEIQNYGIPQYDPRLLEELEEKGYMVNESIFFIELAKCSVFKIDELITLSENLNSFTKIQEINTKAAAFICGVNMDKVHVEVFKKLLLEGKPIDNVIEAYNAELELGFDKNIIDSGKRVKRSFASNPNNTLDVDKYINQGFVVNVGNNVDVNAINGNMNFSLELMNIKMHDGTSFPLKLIFNSNKSNMNELGFNGYGNLSTGRLSSLVENYKIAPGWGLNLSTFHKDGTYYNGEDWIESYRYMDIDVIHLSDGRDVRLKKVDERNYKIEDETIKDLQIEVCDTIQEKQEFNNNQNFSVNKLLGGRWDPAPSLKVRHKDGTIEYFNYDGYFLGQTNKNGNGFIVQYRLEKIYDAEYLYPSKIVTSTNYEIEIDLAYGLMSQNKIKTPTKEIIIDKEIAIEIPVVKEITILDRKGVEQPQKYSFKSDTFYTTYSHGQYGSLNVCNSIINEIKYPTAATCNFQYSVLDRNGSNEFSVQKIAVSESKNIVAEGIKNYCKYKYSEYETVAEYPQNRKLDLYLNSDYQLINEKTFVEDSIIQENNTEYSQDKLPVKKEYISYQGNNNKKLTEHFKYDGRANIIEYTNMMGVKFNYTYDSKYNLLTSREFKISDSKTFKEENVYDSYGNLVSKKITDGVDTSIKNYKLDSLGRLQNINIDNNGQIIKTNFYNQIVYENAMQIGQREGTIYFQKPKSMQMVSEYTEDGSKKNLSRMNIFDQNTQEIIQQINPDGSSIHYTYDMYGRITNVLYPDGKKKTINYDDINNSYIVKDVDGVESRNTYDQLGYLLTNEVKIKGKWVTILRKKYDELYRVVEEINAKGVATAYEYDCKNRIIKTTVDGKLTASYNYDDINNITTTKNQEGELSRKYSDDLGNVICKELEGKDKKFKLLMEYDNIGNVVKKVIGDKQVYQYSYDVYSNLTEVTDPLNQKTRYSYDKLGNLVCREIIDAFNNKQYKTINFYDELGHLIRTVDETGKQTQIIYDINGNIIKYINPDGTQKNTRYDVMGRVLEETIGTSSTKYNYDNYGRVKNIDFTEEAGKSSVKKYEYGYDDLGRVIRASNSKNEFMEYTYDEVGNLTRQKDYFGVVTDYVYNVYNNLESITTNGRSIKYTYHADNMLKDIIYPNGIKTEFKYDGLNKIENINYKLKKGNETIDYAYDSFGNINLIRDKNGRKNYKYDNLNRLIGVENVDSGDSQNLTYDVRSNIISESGHQEIEKIFKLGKNDWDDLGRLKAFTSNKGEKTTYTYGPSGLRESKKNSITDVEYYYDNLSRLTNEIVDGKKISVVYGAFPLMRIIDGSYYFYILNGHGDIIGLSDENGSFQNTYQYDEWGKILKSEEKVHNDLKYAGQIYDEESGNYYLKSRYYNPEIRRFISKDGYKGTIESPTSQNEYIYCVNNPLNYTDPNGNFAWALLLEHLVDTSIETVADVLIDMLLDGKDFNKYVSIGLGFTTNLIPIAGEYRTGKNLAKLQAKYGDDVVRVLKNSDELYEHLDDIVAAGKKGGVEGIEKYLKRLGKKSGLDVATSISKKDLLQNFTKVEDKLKILKDPNGNYANMAKKLGYDNFNANDWRKGIQSFVEDGVRIEYHFVKNIKDGTVMGEKIFKVIDGTRVYLDILK